MGIPGYWYLTSLVGVLIERDLRQLRQELVQVSSTGPADVATHAGAGGGTGRAHAVSVEGDGQAHRGSQSW